MQKNLLTVDEIESQVALELPERETLDLLTLLLQDLLNNNMITLNFNDLNLCLAAQAAVLSNANMKLVQVCH